MIQVSLERMRRYPESETQGPRRGLCAVWARAADRIGSRRTPVIATLVALLLVLATAPALAGPRPPAAAVATAHPLATAAGREILEAGGNAFDAAVAVTAALAVVEPSGSGLGGGGFWLLHRASDGSQRMLDARERAPAGAHRDMYLDTAGELIPGASIDGPLAAGIPGTPAALEYLASRLGRLPLAQSLAPAIGLAREGFPVDERYRRLARFRLAALRASPAAAQVFLVDGEVPPPGHVLRQPDLALTLGVIASKGASGFYRGPVASTLVEGVRAAGGIWAHADLLQYRVLEREPVYTHYRGLRVVSVPPPSSGGVALATMLNILSGWDLEALPETKRTHLVIEAMRRAYRDRAEFLGDSDHVVVPVARLISPGHADTLRRSIDPNDATPSDSLPPVVPGASGGRHTTHFSILDAEGNRVAATLSINYPFGSGFVVPGTGVLLNDEMDDFSAKPGTPNAYGLVGNDANAIAPGKRPLSSMSPTFIEDERGVAILGTPGGSRIITMVLLGILDYAAGGSAGSMVSRPRFHHQYLPDVVQFEPDAFAEEVLGELGVMGHVMEPREREYGNMQVVVWEQQRDEVSAASDPRGIGSAEVFVVPDERRAVAAVNGGKP